MNVLKKNYPLSVQILNVASKNMDNFVLENFVNRLLDVERFQDYCPNGLQIEGTNKIIRIASAVTASLYVIERCIEQKIDALFVHHGYFWKGEEQTIKGLKKKRLSPLIQNNINLFAYHLPLDAYEPWGNNASIAKKLNIDVLEKMTWNKCSNILWSGLLAKSVLTRDFFKELCNCYGPQVIHIPSQKKQIKHVAWCSGAGQDLFEAAASNPIDAFITGEFSERTYYLAKELNIDFFALGHYASEKDGIRNLGEFIANEFKLAHFFIEEDNPF